MNPDSVPKPDPDFYVMALNMGAQESERTAVVQVSLDAVLSLGLDKGQVLTRESLQQAVEELLLQWLQDVGIEQAVEGCQIRHIHDIYQD